MLMRPSGLPSRRRSAHEERDGWSGNFLLKDTDARLIVVLASSGEQKDNNNGSCWTTMVYGADGKPLQDASIAYGNFLAGNGILDFTHDRDYEAGLTAIAKEKSLYPANWKAYQAEWTITLRASRGSDRKADIKGAVDSCFERFSSDDEAKSALVSWLGQVGETGRADSIQKEAIRTNPQGLMAKRARETAISSERDPQTRVDLIESFLKDFPAPGPELGSLQAMLFGAYVQLNQPDKALGVAEKSSDMKTNMYNEIAWDWIEKGENLEKATAIAKRGVDEATNPPDSLRPSYLSEKQWHASVANSRAMILDTYGFGLYKLGKIADAEKAFEGAYRGSKGESPDITERLLMTYNKEGKYEKAVAVGQEVVESGKTNDKVLEYYKEAYLKTHGSTKGYDESLAAAKAKSETNAKAKVLSSRISKPAIPFELKGMDGTTVKLSDLKGKLSSLTSGPPGAARARCRSPRYRRSMKNTPRTTTSRSSHSIRGNAWAVQSGSTLSRISSRRISTPSRSCSTKTPSTATASTEYRRSSSSTRTGTSRLRASGSMERMK